MTSKQIKQEFINFFTERGHLHHASAPLISNDDPSVLFNVAGMQQFKSYYLAPEKAPANKIVTIQPCIRTIDIDEVGDDTHLTFFEMLGNFSFNSYYKKEAIEFAWDFLHKHLKISKDRLSATYFLGDDDLPKDQESSDLIANITGLSQDKINPQSREENFWGPTGAEGPCGPTVEFYLDGVEVWNLVFNEYYKNSQGEYILREEKGVDTGLGLERLSALLQSHKDVYNTDLFKPVLEILNNNHFTDKRQVRIIADHIKAIYFLISENLQAKNIGRGYVLRKLMRRVMINKNIDLCLNELFQTYNNIYSDYQLLPPEQAVKIFIAEKNLFDKSLFNGIKILQKLINQNKKLDGKTAFELYSTYGIPLEAQKDFIMGKIEIDQDGFEAVFAQELKKHQEISRAGVEEKFGGHGILDEERISPSISLDDLAKIKMNHTATHLLQQALREVLGEHIQQKGSDVTIERLRFDFTHPSPLTEGEKIKVEKIVNEKIKENLPVFFKLLTLEQARETGALAFFNDKYDNKVKVYFIGNDDGSAWSKEFCGGPHVKFTGEIKKFKIQSEKSSSAGIRRIKAITG